MTSDRIVTRAQSSSHIYFRLTSLVVAVLLAAQCVWLLLAEFSRPRLVGSPLNATLTSVAAKDRDVAFRAASIGAIRGDLWATAALTYAGVAIGDTRISTRSAADPAVARVRVSIECALATAPTKSVVWLLRTGLALQYPAGRMDPLEALRMSYYTGPSDRSDVPLRLQLAARANGFDDPEIREFAVRDIRMLLAAKDHHAIAVAHDFASKAGKQFVEQTVHDIDPSAMQNLSSPSTKIEPLPD